MARRLVPKIPQGLTIEIPPPSVSDVRENLVGFAAVRGGERAEARWKKIAELVVERNYQEARKMVSAVRTISDRKGSFLFPEEASLLTFLLETIPSA